MSSSKRDKSRVERRLAATLTEACETAAAEIHGFEWLTHAVDPAQFQQSLRVIWVFDTEESKDRAISVGQDARMRELTSLALKRIDVGSQNLVRCVRFDSEEACLRHDGGDWRTRLARIHCA